MLTALFAIALTALVALVLAVLVVSVAIGREDRAGTLRSPARGRTSRRARRVVALELAPVDEASDDTQEVAR